MMRRNLLLGRGWACALLVLVAPIKGQETPNQPTEANPNVPEIADEPRSIDPAEFMPKVLATKATVDFSDSSLREVVQWLRDEHKMAVLVENDALSEIGVLVGDPVSDKLNNQPIYLLLNRLQNLKLAWYFSDDVLHITSAEVAETRLTTMPYNVGDLIDAGFAHDDLSDVVHNSISPDSWEEVGGEGAISFLGDVMFIRQTDPIHRDVRGMLAALRKHGRQTFTLDPPQHQVLRQKLEENVSVDFKETPLKAAVAQLAEVAKVDIRLDAKSLQELGIRERQPISLKLTNRRLQTVLQAMLLDLKLTSILRDGVLWISSLERAELELKSAAYDVRDLCRDHGESSSLTDAIESQTDPVWDTIGGEGTIQFARPGTMVVYNTEKIHRDVLQLLETYRTALRNSKPRRRSEDDPNELLTVYYRMHSHVARDLESLLPRILHPKTWRLSDPNSKGEIFVVSSNPDINKAKLAGANASEEQTDLIVARSVLIIRQTRKIHQDIRDVIRRVENGDSQMTFGSGGGGGFGGGFFDVGDSAK